MVHLLIHTSSVGGSLLDLYENESISQNWRFTDISELAVRGGFSREFRVPASENNVQIFGALDNVNLSTSISFSQKIEATLAVDTIPVANGHIQIKRVYRKMNALDSYEIVFFAETPDLSRSLGDKKLKDLTSLADINHEITFTNVTTNTDEYIWALVDRGQKWSEAGEAGTRRVTSLTSPVYPAELAPCVNGYWLFDKILTEAGFTYDITEIQATLEKYWMPFVLEQWTRTTVDPQSYFFSINYGSNQTGYTGGIAQLTGMTEVYDNSNSVASSVFTAPFTGFFTFRIWLHIDPSGFPTNEYIYYGLADNTTNVFKWYSIVPVNSGSPMGQTSSDATIFLNEGDEIVMQVSASEFNYTILGDGLNDPATGTGWRLVSTSTPLAGETIDFALNAPDYLQADYIRDLVKMHNLAVIPDRNIPNKIKFIPMPDYLGTGTTIDWTGKLDINKDVVISPTTDDLRKKQIFTYKAGSDYPSQFYVKNGQRVYGDYTINGYTVSENELPNDFAQGELKIELALSSTPCENINLTSFTIPKFVNESGDFQVPGARLLYNAGTAEIALYNDGTAAAEAADVNVLNHYSSINAQLDDDDLNFAPEEPLHFITANPYNNLFNKYYRAYLNEIYSNGARYMEAYFDLSLSDILAFQFSDKIYVIDAYWRILEISDYKMGQEGITTKVKLVKIIDAQLDCEYSPTTVTTAGIVNFVDGAGNASFGNEICCTRYGYTWDGVASRCRAFGSGRPLVSQGTQGTNGIGYSISQSMNQLAAFSVYLGSNLNVSPEAIFSLVAGNNIEVEEGNSPVLAVGDTLRLLGTHRGSAMFGKNVRAIAPGLHLGGGWQGDNRTTNEGRAQHGVVILSGNGDFTESGTDINLTIEGISGKHLTLENLTTINAVFEVSVHQYNAAAGTLIGHSVGIFMVRLSKSSNVAAASTVHTIHQDNGFGILGLNVDTTTDTTQHRISIDATGGGSHPYNNIIITAAMRYTQVR